MNWLRVLLARLRGTFSDGGRAEQRLEEELAAHLDMLVEEKCAARDERRRARAMPPAACSAI
jgi:hypothetical protein